MTKHRIPICTAKRLLTERGVNLRENFFALPTDAIGIVLDVAKAAGYRKRRDAPGSTARMFFQYAQRSRCGVRR